MKKKIRDKGLLTPPSVNPLNFSVKNLLSSPILKIYIYIAKYLSYFRPKNCPKYILKPFLEFLWICETINDTVNGPHIFLEFLWIFEKKNPDTPWRRHREWASHLFGIFMKSTPVLKNTRRWACCLTIV